MIDRFIEDVIDYGGFALHVVIAVVLWIWLIILCFRRSEPHSRAKTAKHGMIPAL